MSGVCEAEGDRGGAGRGRQAHGQNAPGKTLVENLPPAFTRGKSRDLAAKKLGLSGKSAENLTPAWMIELELGNKEDLLEKGKAVYQETVGRPKKSVSQNDSDLQKPQPHSTRKTIAKSAGVSTGQVGMAEQVRKKAPELWDKAKTGDIGISTAYKQVS